MCVCEGIHQYVPYQLRVDYKELIDEPLVKLKVAHFESKEV